jgi:hypothetical protein
MAGLIDIYGSALIEAITRRTRCGIWRRRSRGRSRNGSWERREFAMAMAARLNDVKLLTPALVGEILERKLKS